MELDKDSERRTNTEYEEIGEKSNFAQVDTLHCQCLNTNNICRVIVFLKNNICLSFYHEQDAFVAHHDFRHTQLFKTSLYFKGF